MVFVHCATCTAPTSTVCTQPAVCFHYRAVSNPSKANNSLRNTPAGFVICLFRVRYLFQNAVYLVGVLARVDTMRGFSVRVLLNVTMFLSCRKEFQENVCICYTDCFTVLLL